MDIRGLAMAWAVVVASLLVGSPSAGAEENTGPPATVEEARKRAEGILSALQRPSRAPPEDRAEWSAEMLCFLDSSNPEIRQVALDALVDLVLTAEYFPPGKGLEYLAQDRPIRQRAVVLALCMNQLSWYAGRYPKGHTEDLKTRAEVERVKSLAREMLGAEVCTPDFDLFALVLARQHTIWHTSGHNLGIDIAELVDENRRTDVARRLLVVLPTALKGLERRSEDARYLRLLSEPEAQLLGVVLGLGEQHAGETLEAWYRSEPDPAMRRIVLSAQPPSLRSLPWWEGPAWAKRREAILEVAAKDWDERIAAKAKGLLRR